MIIARSEQHLKQELDKLRYCGSRPKNIGLVTSRAGVHEGNGAVINSARTFCDLVVVALYPDQREAQDHSESNVVSALEFHDIGFVEQHKADLLYIPAEDELSAKGTQVQLQHAYLDQLDDSFVKNALTHIRLFNLFQPNVFCCGQKNIDAYFAIMCLVNTLHIQVDIQNIPTVRHANGLPVDPVYDALSQDMQKNAVLLYQTLQDAATAIQSGGRNFDKIITTAKRALKNVTFDIQRFDIIDELNLAAPDQQTSQFRIVAETQLGDFSLNDNIGFTL